MTIVFLCGCSEPGRDGIGDYTRTLVAHLIAKGHKASIIALNDTYCKQIVTEKQLLNEQDIQVLRIPYEAGIDDKVIAARKWIQAEQPDWLSLQFVLFSYHPKGLPSGLGTMLHNITKDHRLHIMFHELWVGMNKEATIKFKVWGWLQKQVIKNMLKKTKPVIIHTQTELYRYQLSSIGYKAQLLPIFSNITITNKAKEVYKNDSIRLIIFGGIHEHTAVTEFAKDAAAYSKQNNKQVELVLIGRNGLYKDRWKQDWEDAGLPVTDYGEQSPAFISDVLLQSSSGICTTPPSLIEKSGSVMAMRTHGLPVICVSQHWHPSSRIPLSLPPNTIVYNKNNFAECLSLQKYAPDYLATDRITCMFIDALLSAHSYG